MNPAEAFDDQGNRVHLTAVRRVVSLVPSLTEALATTAPELLVGATDWCTHPAPLAVQRVGGTKNPRIAAVLALRPDLVLANEEENRAADLDALRQAGTAVWVTEIRTLDQAFRSLDRMLSTACGLDRPRWLDQAREAWHDLTPATHAARAVIPIWRRPWMLVGRDTFTGDLLHRLGIQHLHAQHPERYPAVPLRQILAAAPDLVVLPDEPYRFTAEDGPEAFPGIPSALVSGRHLTWYGPSLVQAPEILGAQLANLLR